jgi:hypothetical protein
LNPDRSSAARLDGSTVTGKIYVFVRNSKTLDKVDFYIDSPQWRRRPLVRTDKKAPFDFAGTSTDGTARSYNTAKLADGTHTIRVVMTWADGMYPMWRSGSGDGGVFTYLSTTPQRTPVTCRCPSSSRMFRTAAGMSPRPGRLITASRLSTRTATPERFDFTDFAITD